MNTCPQCHMELPEGFRFCGNCGAQLAEAPKQEVQTLYFGSMQASNKARLVLIKGEGVDGVTYYLNGDEHLAGREEGDIVFPEDPFLSPRHACFYYQDDQLMVRDEGSVNGVFVRIRQQMDLQPGSRFLVGEQLIQFEPTSEDEFPLKPNRDGTYFYCSPRRPSRFKLLQLLRGGDIGMIFRAPADEIALGREGNDINFPDDPYISGQHARVEARSDGCTIIDLNSKNGTFLLLQEPYQLSHGDYVFLGQQLLRVETN